MRQCLTNFLLVASLFSVTSTSTTAFTADTVVLKNGQRISGTVDPTIDVGPDQVAINTGHGIMRLPKSAIASEDLSFEARKSKLKNDDLAGHLALAAWCRSKGMMNESLALLDDAVLLNGVPLIARAQHARLVDELKSPKEALEWYRRYRKDGGDDPATIARLNQLEKIIVEFEAQSHVVSTAPKGPKNDSPTIPKAAPILQGGMESKGWDNEALQWSNPIQPKVVSLSTETGIVPALQVDFKGGNQEKATIKRTAHLSIGDDSVLTFYVQNPGDKPLSIAIGVKTGSQYLFHESSQQSIKPGKDFQKLRFSFKGASFKSAASKWNYDIHVADLTDVKEIQVLIYNGSDNGSLLISNMGFPTKSDL
jgi:hypothetical protein